MINKMDFTGKRIVLAGSGGIGSATAELLAELGAQMILLDVSEENLKDTITNLTGEGHAYYVCDFSAVNGLEAIISKIIQEQGAVDGYVHCTGIGAVRPLKMSKYDFMLRVMNINFYGTLYMVKSFLPHLLTRPQAHIVNVSSMGAFAPVPGQTFYGASKAAVKALTEGLMTELMDTNVEVSEVFPGAVATDIQVHSGVKNAKSVANYSEEDFKKAKAKVTVPSEAAEIIVSGMEAGKWKIIIGKDCKQMDLLTRLAPRFAMKKLAEAMKKLHAIK